MATKEEERFETLVAEWKARMRDLQINRDRAKTHDQKVVADAAYVADDRATEEALCDLFVPGWREDPAVAIAAKYALLWDVNIKAVCLIRKEQLPNVPRVNPSANKQERYDAENRSLLLMVFKEWLQKAVAQLPTQEVWVHFLYIEEGVLGDQAVYGVKVPAGISFIDEALVSTPGEATANLNVLRRQKLQLPDISDPEVREGRFKIFR